MANSKLPKRREGRFKTLYLGETQLTATATQLNAVTANVTTNTSQLATTTKVATLALVGTTIHSGIVAWTNPEAGDILITRIVADITTVAGQAGTISVGTTAVSAATASANLLDTLDVRTAAGVFDNITDKGTLGKSRQRIATGKWVTVGEASGNTSTMVGVLYIHYTVV